MSNGRLGFLEVKRWLVEVLSTRTHEIDCDECHDQLDLFVEITLSVESAAEAMPLVQCHLDHCQCCREEYEALLTVVRVLR
jgi:hypothetical protein